MIVLFKILSLLCWALAAACNGLMDRISTEPQFNQSIFRRSNKQFWCLPFSKGKGPFGYKWDAWHLAKSSMIILMALTAVFTYKGGLHTTSFGIEWLAVVVEVLLLGSIWNAVMPKCYGYFFKAKVFRGRFL